MTDLVEKMAGEVSANLKPREVARAVLAMFKREGLKLWERPTGPFHAGERDAWDAAPWVPGEKAMKPDPAAIAHVIAEAREADD